MTTDHSYRLALPTPTAVAELRRCAGTQFDPAVVAALIVVVGARGRPAGRRRLTAPVRGITSYHRLRLRCGEAARRPGILASGVGVVEWVHVE